ncbi:unnamed protein product [Closterium sp. Naga37s-1]|nr:unnamed protein product [Closterium sp. Naga37s-1]
MQERDILDPESLYPPFPFSPPPTNLPLNPPPPHPHPTPHFPAPHLYPQAGQLHRRVPPFTTSPSPPPIPSPHSLPPTPQAGQLHRGVPPFNLFPSPPQNPSAQPPRLGNYIGGFPQAAMGPLLDLMFLPSGLNLNIVRFNIGGGSVPQYSPQLYEDSLMPAQAAGFNWTADSRQQAVLLGAKARGRATYAHCTNDFNGGTVRGQHGFPAPRFASCPPLSLLDIPSAPPRPPLDSYVPLLLDGGCGPGLKLGNFIGGFPHSSFFLPLPKIPPPTPRLGNYIGGFPQAAMDPLLDLMFLPSGLNLNIVRFNIGGGSLPQYSPQLHSDALLRWRAMPGYWPAQAAGFNWTADSRQQAVLLGAKARGVNVFEAFSNSPPWWMTASKDVAGGKKAFQTNLLPKFEGRFAKYLVEVVERFKTDPALGNIEFDTLEPFNEALEGHWLKGMGQEGCNFNVFEMSRIIFKTLRLLREKKLKTKLAGVDSFPGMTALLFPLLVGNFFFHRVNVHGYTLPVQQVVNMTASVAEKTYAARYVAMKVLAKSLGKEIWVSESGPEPAVNGADSVSAHGSCVLQ